MNAPSGAVRGARGAEPSERGELHQWDSDPSTGLTGAPWWVGVAARMPSGRIGTLEAFDGHIATVRMDDGTVEVGYLCAVLT